MWNAAHFWMSFPATDVIYFWTDLNLPACVYFTAEFHHNKQSRPQWQIEFERRENSIRFSRFAHAGPGFIVFIFLARYLAEREGICAAVPGAMGWEEDVWWLSVFLGSLIAEWQGVTTVGALTHYQRALVSHGGERETFSPAKLNTMTATGFWLTHAVL